MTPPQSLRPLIIGFLRRGYSASGGVEVYLKGLAEGLRSEGHRVILLGTEEWPAEAWPGGEILRCKGQSLSVYAAEVERQKATSGIAFDLILSVEKVPGCDIYRTDEGLHRAWLTTRENYVSFWARSFQWWNPKHREKLALEKQLFQPHSTRRVISISEKITRDIRALYDYPLSQIRMIHNGVPLLGIPTPEERTQARSDLGIVPEEKIILFVGTGWERKGLRFALCAVEQLVAESKTEGSGTKKITLLVAGKGSVRRYASPIVRFLGPVKQMAPVYAAADLFVTPTIFEPFSLAALEALSSGLPVITSAAAGISEIMTPGVHGEIIEEPSDIASLAKSLRKWLTISDDPESIATARAACSELASGFTLERNLRETLSLIHEVIAEKKGK